MQPPNNDFPSYNEPLPPQQPFGNLTPPNPSQTPQPYGSQPPTGQVSLDAIGEAWELVKPNLGIWLVAGFIFLAISAALNAIQRVVFPRDSLFRYGLFTWLALYMLFLAINFVINQFIGGSMMKLAVTTVRTGQSDIGAMLNLGSTFGNVLSLGVLATVLIFVAALPGIVLSWVGIHNSVGGAGGLGGIVLGFVLIVVAIPIVACLLFFALPLVVDKERGAMEAISESISAAKSRFGAIFLLLIVLGLLNIGGMLLCCVGLIFTIPLTQVTWAVAYKNIFGLNPFQPTLHPGPPIADPNSFQ